MKNNYLKVLVIISLPFLNSCMFTYLLKSSYYQSKLLQSRVPINDVLNDEETDINTKEKLKLIIKTKSFVNNNLKLKASENYSTYVELDQPYVTYLLRVSYPYEVKSYQWSFPFFGKFPYLGFFRKSQADAEEKKFSKKYDTYIRGVSAYSTLGWFEDPILSSMIAYSDFNLVSTIIHESIHENLFFNDHVKFNEQLADFLGDKAAILYFNKTYGQNSPQVKDFLVKQEDKKLFIDFIINEVNRLNLWYKKNPNEIVKSQKKQRLRQIQIDFENKVKPFLKTKSFQYFSSVPLNNAKLLPYVTYHSELHTFERVYTLCQSDFFRFFQLMKSFEKSKDPLLELKNIKSCDTLKINN